MKRSDVERSERPDLALPSIRHARADRTAWWGGLLASAILHALLFVLWVGEAPAIEEAAAGARQPRVRAGGGALQATRVSIPERAEIPPPPEPILSVEVPQVDRTVEPVQVALEGAELLPAGRPAPLPGIGGGPVRGRGGGDGEGEGYLSPVPRSVIPQWDPPSSVRGMEVTVRVFVDAAGQPTGIVELDPPTPDAGFNREIMKQVREWEYQPARRNGSPVEGWAEITFIF
ncbi:MAG: energy transducer TonB [Gemmatimonadetes bacterium]|nr:energy transducer TonB [Gemmatimonadota bacterium]